MFKRSALLAVLVATAAFAAPAKGKVMSVKERTVVVKTEGALAPWVKKGIQVKINHKLNGKITAVDGATVTLSSPKADELKAGEEITFDKSLAAAGC
jgi:RNase P/RNase MRP subunit p29